MKRFVDDQFYKTSDPALAVFGTRGSLNQKRHKGSGPPYIKIGSRILYEGRVLNEWLDQHRIDPKQEK